MLGEAQVSFGASADQAGRGAGQVIYIPLGSRFVHLETGEKALYLFYQGDSGGPARPGVQKGTMPGEASGNARRSDSICPCSPMALDMVA